MSVGRTHVIVLIVVGRGLAELGEVRGARELGGGALEAGGEQGLALVHAQLRMQLHPVRALLPRLPAAKGSLEFMKNSIHEVLNVHGNIQF